MATTPLITAEPTSGRAGRITPARVIAACTVVAAVAAALALRTTSAPPAVSPTGVGATGPATSVVFADSFGAGDLSAWTAARTGGDGAVAVVAAAVAGRPAVRLTESDTRGSYAYLRETLPGAETTLDVQADYRVTAEGLAGTSNTTLLRLFDPAYGRELTLLRQNGSGRLWIQHDGVFTWTGVAMPLGAWRTVTVHLSPLTGGRSEIRLDYNGNRAWTYKNADLGSNGIAVAQFGNETPGQSSDQYVANVVMTGNIPPVR